MYQVFFLSIVTLVLTGLTFCISGYIQDATGWDFVGAVIMHPTYRLILGVITIIVGIFSLLKVYPGDTPIIGDLLPALTGIFTGLLLIIDYYKDWSETESPFIMWVDRVFLQHKTIIGIFTLVVALFHFIMPTALFL